MKSSTITALVAFRKVKKSAKRFDPPDDLNHYTQVVDLFPNQQDHGPPTHNVYLNYRAPSKEEQLCDPKDDSIKVQKKTTISMDVCEYLVLKYTKASDNVLDIAGFFGIM